MEKGSRMNRGHLFIVSGPSGAGKGTILKAALPQIDNIAYSISYTTRKPRTEDKEGVTYFFVSQEAFRSMIDNGEFLEWAEVHGNCYGTGKKTVLEHLDNGKDVFLEIDVQGALQVKKVMPEAITVFIMPPTIEILKNRLEHRATETKEELELRMRNAEFERKYSNQYDKIVVNDELERAVSEFIDIVKDFRRN